MYHGRTARGEPRVQGSMLSSVKATFVSTGRPLHLSAAHFPHLYSENNAHRVLHHYSKASIVKGTTWFWNFLGRVSTHCVPDTSHFTSQNPGSSHALSLAPINSPHQVCTGCASEFQDVPGTCFGFVDPPTQSLNPDQAPVQSCCALYLCTSFPPRVTAVVALLTWNEI